MRWGILALCLLASAASAADSRTLTACADPNDLPFSNRAGKGFENQIMALLAKDMGVRLEYLWWPQRLGYVRKTLNAGRCEVWPGVAAGLDRVASTVPYYRSTYVFVTRRDSSFGGLTLDDPRLVTARIGVQMIGNDATNTPPAHAIASRGLTQNVRGYMLYGDYGRPAPAAAIVEAVERSEVDVALVWGPLAGYVAGRSPVPLWIEPVTPATDARWPMAFDIAMGVRRGDDDLLNQVNAILEREKPAIDAILRRYRVPVIARESRIDSRVPDPAPPQR